MKNRIIVIITFLAGIVLMNSCLKDDADYWKDDVAGKMYATVLTPTLQALSMNPVPDTVDFEFMINIASDVPPANAVTVEMMVDTAAVTAYSKRTGKAYKAFPTVKIVTPSVVIAAGTRTGMVKAKVWGADKLNACDNFIAAISIKSTNDPNVLLTSNMKSYLLSLPISNPYAATYQCVGYRIRPGNPTEPVNAAEQFSTVDCKTVKKQGFGNYMAYWVEIEVTQETVIVGGVTCYKVIATPYDPITEKAVGDMFTTWTGDPTLEPADKTINYYNPAPAGGGKPYFILNCYYVSSAGNRIMYETLTRL